MKTERSMPIGWRRSGGAWCPHEIPLANILGRSLVTGTAGAGKSGFLTSVIAGLLTRHPQVGVVVIDVKGDLVPTLRDHLLPAMAERHAHLAAERLVSIAPFGAWGVPLNPLCPITGLASEIQAHIVCSLVSQLSEDGLGTRAAAILNWLLRAVIPVGGTFKDVLRLLRDESSRRRLAARVSDVEVREYLLETFSHEPPISVQSLASRVEMLLNVRELRAMLCAPSCISGRDLIESPLTFIDLGNAPGGSLSLARFVGGFLLQLLTSAVFSRATDPTAHPVLLLADEFHELIKVKSAAEDFERLLSLARFKGVGIMAACQTVAQVSSVSPALLQSLLTNLITHVLFRPSSLDLKHVLPLMPATGRVIDPRQPDSLLSPEAEVKSVVKQCASLPPRHAVVADFLGGRAEVIRTLDIPFDEARRRALKLPAELRESFLRGAHGIPMRQMIEQAQRCRADEVGGGAEDSAPSAAPVIWGEGGGRKRRPTKRPPLEVEG